MKLLIALPVKSGEHYAARMRACEQTWLSNLPEGVDYKGFSDADLGLVEIDQHKNDIDPIRTWRTKLMVKYAYDMGYDFVFRVDTDSYVWVNRLLASGFEQYDYMGWCVGFPIHCEKDWGINTVHGGMGFTLSRRAMQIVSEAEVEKYYDGRYWGDLWAGNALWRKGIRPHRDTRFLDGSNGTQHHGNIFAHELPPDHPYISVHPVPKENMLEIHARFANLTEHTLAPMTQIWWTERDFNHGQRMPEICPCAYCHETSTPEQDRLKERLNR